MTILYSWFLGHQLHQEGLCIHSCHIWSKGTAAANVRTKMEQPDKGAHSFEYYLKIES